MSAPEADSLLLRDPRVRSVLWRDLVDLDTRDRVREVLLPLPWLLLALLSAWYGLLPLALAASFYFYLTGLRLVHDTFHRNLGLPARVNEALLVLLSVLMLGSMHAVRITHLQHHRDCLGPEDTEGATARRSSAGALLYGVLFPFQLHAAALRLATPPQRRWIVGELALNAIWILAVLASGSRPLVYHVLAMAAGQAFTGFFAVWTVHHDCERWHQLARTLRSRFKSALAFGMFYHLEHHLFPRVPTCRLPTLAGRLDRAAPDLELKKVY